MNDKNSHAEYVDNHFQIISMIFLTIMIGTYLLAYKLISIHGYTISAGIFIFPFSYAIIDIITEVYGYRSARILIKNCFLCCLIFAVIVPLIANISPPKGWEHQHEYTFIFGGIFRFFIANSIGMVIGITLNGYLIARWKVALKGRYFWLRSIASSSAGELITSVIADIIAFAGVTPIDVMLKMMLYIYIVKLFYSVSLAFPNSLLVTHLKLKMKKNSHNNYYFNPFNSPLNNSGKAHAFNS